MSLSKISLLIVPGKSLNYLFHDESVVCFIFCKFQRCTTRIAFSPYLVTEIWFCLNLLGKDLTRCFMIISMCVVHSLSISSLRPKGNLSITSHSKTAFRNSFGKQLKSLVSWWLWCLWHILQPLTLCDTNRITSLPSHCRSRFVRSFWKLTKPGVLSWLSCL